MGWYQRIEPRGPSSHTHPSSNHSPLVTNSSPTEKRAVTQKAATATKLATTEPNNGTLALTARPYVLLPKYL